MHILKFGITLLSLYLCMIYIEANAEDYIGKKDPSKGTIDDAKVSGQIGNISDAQNYNQITLAWAEGQHNAEANNNIFTVSGTNYNGKIWSIYAAHADVVCTEAHHEEGKIYQAKVDNNKLFIKGLTTIETNATGTIYAGNADLEVVGGAPSAGSKAVATNNIVVVSGNSIINMRVLGAQVTVNGKDDIAWAEGNKAVVKDSSVLWNVFGAEISYYSSAKTSGLLGIATAKDNKVLLENSIVGSDKLLNSICGVVGNGKTAILSGNIVKIENCQTDTMDRVCGVSVITEETNESSSNHVEISNSPIDGGVVIGSLLNAGKKAVDTGSSVTITDTRNVSAAVYGANVFATAGDAATKGSFVKITGSTVSSNACGALAYGMNAADDEGSFVQITDNSTVSKAVYGDCVMGGSSAAGKGGSVKISGSSTVADNAMGAYAYASYGDAVTERGSVDVTGSTVAKTVYGALVMGGSSAADEGSTVKISNSTAAGAMGAHAYAPYGDASTRGSSVEITGKSIVSGNVYGANAYGSSAADEGSSVKISNSTVAKTVYGANVYACSDDAVAKAGASPAVAVGECSSIEGNVYGVKVEAVKDAQADGHTVIISDSSVSGSCMASYAGSFEGSSTASNNTVSLKGGTYKNSIYGGRASAEGEGEKGYTALSQNNTIILAPGSDGSSPVFDEDESVIWGSKAITDGYKTDKSWTSGNTIQFDHVKGMTAANLKNVSTLDYQLPHMRAGEAVLTVKDGDFEGTDISDASVHVAVFSIEGGDGGEFREGERIILLQNQNEDSLITDGIKKEPVTAQQGISLEYELLMETDDRTLYLTRKGMSVTPESRAVSEGWLAGLGLVTQAANLVDDLSMRLNDEGWLPFAYVDGGSMRYNTGSHIDLNSLSLIAGIGRGVRTDPGLFIVGAFFEYGTGAYKTHNSTARCSSIDGDGNAWYMGAGLLASMDFKDTGPGHFYLEGSGHMGSLHNYYSNDDLRFEGRSGSFETDTPYYAFHFGAGYVWNIDEENTLDIYGKYFWARIDGTEETLTTGDPIVFDDAESVRTRLGAKYSRKVNEHLNAYIGAAWEHEFAGDSDSRAYGHDLASPSLRGDSVRGELGIELVPTKDLPLTVNLGVQGYLGQKEGVTGSCFIQYSF